MKIIKPSIEIITPISETVVLKHIECCGRVCYKSEDRIRFGTLYHKRETYMRQRGQP